VIVAPPAVTVECSEPTGQAVALGTPITSDVCDANPQVTLLSAVSDEPDDGTGDGHTSNDVQGADVGTDDRKFQVRAERKGNGDGRIYTVRYQAEDHSGNTTPAEGTVSVAKSQGKK